MKIGELAERVGTTATTIRYYEKIGLISPAARVSGVRQFGPGAVETLQFIQLAQAAGFELTEMKALLNNYATNQSTNTMWNQLAQEKRVCIQDRIAQLQQMDRILESLIECRCSTLTDCVTAAHAEDGATRAPPQPPFESKRIAS